MKQDLPTDVAYQRGIPVEVEKTLLEGHNGKLLEEQIDWDVSVDAAERTRKVTERVAALRHYGNVSKLLICETLWRQSPEAPLPFIIKETVCQTANEMALWGKYMLRINGGGTIPWEMKNLYNCLFTEDDTATTILGITTLNIMARHFFSELQDEGDPLFNAIVTTLDDSNTRFDHLVGPYKTVVGNRSRTERKDMMATLASYIDNVGHTARHDSIGFPEEKWDEEQRWEQVHTPVKKFYQDIGLTEGIF